MDKDVMKRLLRDAGIPVAPFVILKSSQKDEANFTSITNTLGKPIFVKPANMGSSVGISKVTTSEEFNMAVEKAFNHDTKIIIEAAVIGEEIECALLGNDQPQTSVIGKITPHAEFYSYEAKYLDPNGAALEIPAIIPENITKKAQNLALKTFKTLECSGLARVDMFVTSTGEVLVNEINTMPGFTSISMYPKLWEASGITYSELITRLIELALERAASKRY
jgi:D-alanine-D-alanine ligase